MTRVHFKRYMQANKGRRRRAPVETTTRAHGAIKVRLDPRTIITLASMKMFLFWKQRYPDAQVIENT